MTQIVMSHFDSPIGRILAASREGRIVKISLPSERHNSAFKWLRRQFPNDLLESGSAPELTRLFGQLADYFDRHLQQFDLPIETFGSDFQKNVWTALLNIPYGHVVSYGELARRLGKPVAASRAIGSANGSNPIPIVVPCHRVVGHDGKLVGYGGGLETKAWLLRLEAQQEPLPFDGKWGVHDSADRTGIPGRLPPHSKAVG